MENNTNPFRKAGIVLLVIGIIDIGVMIYSIANEISYSSSLNIFSVIAGIFLLKGGVKTARVVRWFSIFLVIGFIGALIVSLLFTPFDLLLTQLKLNMLSMIYLLVFGLSLIAALIWVHLQLSTPEALKVLAKSGYKTGKPTSAYIGGVGILLVLVTLSIVLLNGKAAQNAKDLARKQHGPDYKYHISSMSTSGNSGRASVIAYSDKEIKHVQVQW